MEWFCFLTRVLTAEFDTHGPRLSWGAVKLSLAEVHICLSARKRRPHLGEQLGWCRAARAGAIMDCSCMAHSHLIFGNNECQKLQALGSKNKATITPAWPPRRAKACPSTTNNCLLFRLDIHVRHKFNQRSLQGWVRCDPLLHSCLHLPGHLAREGWQRLRSCCGPTHIIQPVAPCASHEGVHVTDGGICARQPRSSSRRLLHVAACATAVACNPLATSRTACCSRCPTALRHCVMVHVGLCVGGWWGGGGGPPPGRVRALVAHSGATHAHAMSVPGR